VLDALKKNNLNNSSFLSCELEAGQMESRTTPTPMRNCLGFAEARVAALADGAPFRRCCAVQVPWRFRLLNPNAVHSALLVGTG
jgi:hypothetical protein